LEVSWIVLRWVHLVASAQRGRVLVEVFHSVPHVVDRKRNDLERKTNGRRCEGVGKGCCRQWWIRLIAYPLDHLIPHPYNDM
jgi:hypothetical protein